MGGRDLVALGTVQSFLGNNGAVLVDERRHETDRRGADRLAVDRDGPAGRMDHKIFFVSFRYTPDSVFVPCGSI